MNFHAIDTYDFHLPQALIAQYPLAERTSSRLLVVQGQQLAHQHFSDLLHYLEPGDLLVRNNTKVLPARLHGQKESGGKVECLLERVLSSDRALVHLRSNKTPKPGCRLLFEGAVPAVMVEREGDLFVLEFDGAKTVVQWLEAYGHVPLPPYIARQDEETDNTRYQTVYAKTAGAVAAPTAGLHFDEGLLQAIEAKGVQTTEVTLHVGAGTFQPVKVNDITQHHMHSEWVEVDQSVCDAVMACKKRGGRVFAVGTTTVRCLEAAAQAGDATDALIAPFRGETDIFIYPGYTYKVIDALITNFHLPKSTLMMLVCAFGGYASVMLAYQTAVEEAYRFFSYGDAMLLFPEKNSVGDRHAL